ncbi:hypothetical protein D3H65_14290 [Paraflavitalea soli]|uniref:Uncharacterized protein n=1 Tax=Paraflavitalea soli TaxID=2315862 RepID=A0A3B7MQ15_9BACT|nr:hypothetical protein [Paraflavitalea soli]AXY75076.1 hypothetical protein D3H65_14290 [Paraflavitalea soli]
MKYSLLFLLVGVPGMRAAAQPPDSMLTRVQGYFELIRTVCATPQAKLWNKDLDGPVLFVEPATRKAYANRPDTTGILRAAGGIYTGVLPLTVSIANTATTWAGVKWTMMLLPLPADKDRAVTLMAHELFHRVQDELGLPTKSPVCDHLNTKEGRIYFRLELEALKAALRQPVGRERQHHLQQAILFRQWRYRLFPPAQALEEALEFNEGLAEFTGVYVSGIARKDTGYLSAIVDNATTSYPSFARSFAYLTGPLYGMLLSQKQADWQRGITAKDNFPDLLIKNYQLQASAAQSGDPQQTMQLAVTKATREYRPSILQEEEVREQQRIAKQAVYMAKLVQGPVLELKLSKSMRFSFNPNTLFPLGEEGTVYPTMTLTDDWGRLVVTGDARMKDWRLLYVAMPANTNKDSKVIKTAEWELTLADGWHIAPGKKAGDQMITKTQ